MTNARILFWGVVLVSPVFLNTDSRGNERIIMGPLVLQSGATLSGVTVQSVRGPCVIVAAGAKDVLIESSKIGPCGTDSPEDYGVSILPNASNITVRNNRIGHVSTGVRATSATNPIYIQNNIFTHIRGPLWSGQAIQFNNVNGGTSSSLVSCNVSDAWAPPSGSGSGSKYEDHISMYASGGTPSAPTLIWYNKVRGGTSKTGGGITVGDRGGGWIDVRKNVVVKVANSGIGVAGGSHISVRENIVDNRGQGPDSLTHLAYFARALSSCDHITFTDNLGVAHFWNWGEELGARLTSYRALNPKCENVHLSGNDFNADTIPAHIFDRDIAECTLGEIPSYRGAGE